MDAEIHRLGYLSDPIKSCNDNYRAHFYADRISSDDAELATSRIS
jgi:hypothetical protein